ncbi:hypothetical protein [Blastococcus sp. SYSU D00695]
MPSMHLRRAGRDLDLQVGRAGLRTTATLLAGSAPVAEGRGLGRVLLRLPAQSDPAPAVLVLSPWPGVVARALLLEPAPAEPGTGDADAATPDGGAPDRVAELAGLATARRHPFDAAPGTLAGRLRAVEERHPRLWAARHVVWGVARVLAALLGIAVLLQALVRPVLRWLAGLVPEVDLPDLPLPDISLPDIPLPDISLPDVSLPGWVSTVLATAKFWAPVAVGLVLAVREVRRRREPPPGDGREPGPEQDDPDAHR